ncbi:50S ribosomal protein L4 [Candidatus Woesearchaeota archaeon]|nr:50S ribosomal protein L4 [Candidatus Woesearchaeota archaeon]
MKVNVVDAEKGTVGQVELPQQFAEEFHPDLIARAVLSIESKARQPYGSDPESGKRYSAKISRRRRDYKGAYGHGISRVPRKTMSRSGTRFNWTAALAPGTVGGRQAHPPKAEKVWAKKINKNENRKAIRSALAATMVPSIVSGRGHVVPKGYPFIASAAVEDVTKTRDVVNALRKFGFEAELARVSGRTIRAGKGKTRGRRYRVKKGPLIVVSAESSKLIKSARNIMGVDVAVVNRLNAHMLAPGTAPGRLTLFTAAAIERLGKEKLFT